MQTLVTKHTSEFHKTCTHTQDKMCCTETNQTLKLHSMCRTKQISPQVKI